MDLGCRVVRGPDWEWDDQDGGEGMVGVVVHGTENTEGTVWVQWEAGKLANYRAGLEGKMDLRVFDSSGKGISHNHVMCDGCSQNPLIGIRWKCLKCKDYDLCTSCYMGDTHELDCEFTRIDESHGKGTSVGKREGATKIQAKGMFCGARVQRGPNWQWREQDGGQGGQGTVLKLQEWKGNGKKCGVSIRWDHTKRDNIYRHGFEGKVDLIVVTPVSGGFYYKDHLPGLVARPKKTLHGFSTGNKVRICVAKDELKEMAEGHGGWNESMEECLTKIGEVYDFTKSGDVIVNYDGIKWRLTTTAITLIPKFNVGDKVLVSSDKKFVMQMQKDHGGWNENMKSMLGMIGTVKSIKQDDEDVVIKVEDNIWLVNSAILTIHEPAAAATKSSGSDDELDNMVDPLESFFKQQLVQKMLSELIMGDDDKSTTEDNNDSPDGSALVQAVSHGHLSHAKQILKSTPEVVNSIFLGKTSLHLACHNGFCDIIKVLLETPNCDTSVKDSQGYMAMHHAAYGDKSGEAIKLMLAHGVDPNITDNENKCTPFHLAVKETNISAVRVLIQTEVCDVNLQDAAGDTPLHNAIEKRNNAIVDLILDASRLNLTLINRQGFNCLHLCAYKGNSYATRKLLSKSPELLNVAKDDGFTALHLAAINDHCEVAEILLEHPDCEIDGLTKNQQTPLMFAVNEGYLTMVQALEQKGANVNATDEDGDTPLHISLAREKFLATGMGQMLSLLGNKPTSFTEISRYLISHGADVRKINHIGKTPMDFGAGTTVEEELRKAYEDTKKTLPEEKEEEKTIKITNQFQNIKATEASDDDSIATDKDESADQQSNVSAVSGEGDVTQESNTSVTPQNEETQFENNLQTGATENKVELKEQEEFQNEKISVHPKKPNATDGPTGMGSCLICVDQQADVVFEPCGHRVMCRACSTRAKRCPECKKDIVSKKTENTELPSEDNTELLSKDDKEKASMEEKLQALEKKLRKLEESVTCCVCLSRRMNMVFTCGHGACQVCSEQLSECAICKKDIEKKIAMF